jgi:hypothetical protein
MAEVVRLVGRLFSFGQTVMTAGVAYDVTAGLLNPAPFLARHGTGDWGDLDAEDKRANDIGLNPATQDRLFSKYNVSGIEGETAIYIITEWDRSVTTILYPSEY